MPKCAFEQVGGDCVCAACGRVVSIPGLTCDRLNAVCGRKHRTAARNVRAECRHLGDPTGENVQAVNRGCRTAICQTAMFVCAIHGRCTLLARAKDSSLPYCRECGDYRA